MVGLGDESVMVTEIGLEDDSVAGEITGVAVVALPVQVQPQALKTTPPGEDFTRELAVAEPPATQDTRPVLVTDKTAVFELDHTAVFPKASGSVCVLPSL